jgi:hypothetical protein
MSIRVIDSSWIYEYYYSCYKAIKKPTSQEKCGPMPKKVLKPLNYYRNPGSAHRDVVSLLTSERELGYLKACRAKPA